ncbi:MAG: hypothetical protein JJU29_15185 [Verrucomicrobia bacterium]|nr:hypothetical protein [Verrucomicrobiota bacterium]MCH8512448.1 hypothetical protein [Kiritimatiellia bacterium]
MKSINANNTFLRLVRFLILVASVVMLGVVFMLGVIRCRAFIHHPSTRMLSNGRAIHQLIFTYEPFDIYRSSFVDVWPTKDSEHYESNSTSYFAWLMSSEVMVFGEDYELFSGAGIPQANSLEEFQSDHNVWSVVADVDKASDSRMPFLVTRNLNESRLVDWQGTRQNELENLGSRKPGGYVTPFNRRKVMVIRVDGGGESISRRNLIWENLNPVSADHAILEP